MASAASFEVVRRWTAPVVRELYRRERIPARVRWWLVADGMRDWYRLVARDLRPHLGDEAKPVMADLVARTLERRYEVLSGQCRHLPSRTRDQRSLALVMGGLYRMHGSSRGAWIFDSVGGAARGPVERLRAQRLVAPIAPDSRWRELAVHLGEWLVVLTEALPERLPRAQAIIADICFRAGVRFGEHARRTFGIGTGPSSGDPAADAIEALRMTEYLFRVNPKHWSETDTSRGSGYLEGTACPWYTRPGWDRMHCGIFGQFQSGICSVFGLDYHLSRTIPKHGGSTCRVDLQPLRIRRSADA